MKSRSGWRKLVVTLVVVGAICQVTFMPKNEVLAGATAAQGKFNMSYLFFGDPSSYTSQVNKSGETLDVVSPSYFHIKEDGSLEVSDLASFFHSGDA